MRSLFLRWDRVLAGMSIVLPLTVSCGLGFVWMIQRGWFLEFVIASIGLGGLVTLARIVARRWTARRTGQPVEVPRPPGATVRRNPDWDAREDAAFAAAQALIGEMTRTPIPWDYAEMQTAAFDVVRVVAETAGGKRKDALQFTLPEALLLIERVASRTRSDLRRMVPFSDSVNLRTLTWMWQNRFRAQAAAQAGYAVWRMVRMVKNPPVGIMQEIDRAVAGGHQSYLTTEALSVAQAVLLEEVAKAAVDLYSGRLRFSDTELLDIQIADGAVDRARLARPDAPLRIVVAGQVSSGKSTLINTLRDEEAAETDLGPTTERATAWPGQIAGVDVTWLDLPGLDGTDEVQAAVLQAMMQADMVVWVARANRPARAIDARVIADWTAAIAADPARRPPPLIAVASCIDTLLPGWPFPEHRLPHDAGETVAAVVRAIARDIGTGLPVPVCAIPPDWNLDTLQDTLAAHMTEALMVQRNRTRIDAARPSTRTEALRGAAGLGRGLTSLGRRLGRRAADPGEGA